jgi:type IV fimbrial biogenesis protein FimT
MKRTSRGFSVLEVMVVVAIIGILLSVGVPSFFTYTQNMQIRSAAEQITAGLAIAKNEAIRRNSQIELALSNNTGWTVTEVTSGGTRNVLQTRDANEGSVNVTSVVLPAGTLAVTFNGMGRVVSVNDDGTPPLTQIDLTNLMISTATDRRNLRIVIPIGGAVRMCDPVVTGTDPRTCP